MLVINRKPGEYVCFSNAETGEVLGHLQVSPDSKAAEVTLEFELADNIRIDRGKEPHRGETSNKAHVNG